MSIRLIDTASHFIMLSFLAPLYEIESAHVVYLTDSLSGVSWEILVSYSEMTRLDLNEAKLYLLYTAVFLDSAVISFESSIVTLLYVSEIYHL